MMDWPTILAFLAATMVLLVTPGPVMAIVMGNTLSGGQVTGFRTVLGVGLGEVALIGFLAISFLLSSRLFGDIFPWFSLASAAYLTWLAANTILRTTEPSAETIGRRSSRPFFDGLAITVSNPTALLFYSAFFVPFVRESESLPLQLAVFAALYVLLSLFFDFACVDLRRQADARQAPQRSLLPVCEVIQRRGLCEHEHTGSQLVPADAPSLEDLERHFRKGAQLRGFRFSGS